MSSIFDNMDDNSNDFGSDQPGASDEGTFIVQFGTESAQVKYREGMTIKDAFTMNADFLGFDSDRSLAYRDNNNNLLDGSDAPDTGMVYTSSITFDEKG